jgi:hypothetical protein
MECTHARYVPLEDPRRQEPAFAALLEGYSTLAQRTPEWFALRSNKVSGSKLSALLFFRRDADRRQCLMEMIGVVPRAPLDARGKQNVAWGLEHEKDAIAWVLDQVPDMLVFDAGFQASLDPLTPWLGSSPDGLVYAPTLYGHELAVLECKCACKRGSDGKTIAYSAVPYYYIGQCYWHMITARRECKLCIFVCWAESGSRAWRVEWDDDVWLVVFDLVTLFLSGDSTWPEYRNRAAAAAACLRDAAAAATPLL